MVFLISAIFFVVHLLVSKGLLYCIASLASYVYLKFTRIFFGRRFDLYNFKADDDPEKLGLFVPREEYGLEAPQNALHLKKNADSVFFMGVNSHGESLTVRISRKPGSQVQCSLFLRTSNGCTYTIPEEHSIQPEVDEPRTFGSSRFKLQCLIPMRRWRVFFNGTLEERSPDQTSASKYRHVKFAFLWVASADVFDYSSDMSPSLLTDAAARNTSWRWPPVLLLQRLRSIFNSYEQCGMFLGTVAMEGEPEKEIYLWGCRGHYMGKTYGIEDGDFEDIYVNSENGTFIHLGTMNISGMIRNFTYGFVMRANGYIFPIEKCLILEEDITGVTKKVRVFAESEEYTISVSKERGKMNFLKEYCGESSVTPSSAHLNAMKGRSLIYEGTIQPGKTESSAIKQAILLSAKDGPPPTSRPVLSVSFQDQQCQLLSVSGGKGSSLAKLSVISDHLKSFIVPKGFAITTTAYQGFIRGGLRDAVKKFERTAWKMSRKEIKAESQRLVDEVSKAKLPEAVKLSIQQSLLDIFGGELGNKKFAVRSSATGEDTEQMSAAGQMETFLGCNGLEEIFEAVKKCWASQFSHTAVEYKRRYGQLLNTPMAVVIQEMVPCDAAGVIFTCDPVTGNPSFISITANYGLGESVVGASADPDTITLERDIYNEINFHSEAAGKKKSKIVLDETGGTKEIHVEGDLSNEYCVSRETAYMLGQIAVQVEEIFGTPRDIEWGVLDGKVFLFQSRPVTSLDTETDFEIKHSIDSHMRREDEIVTSAHVGEVLPGALSNLGLSFFLTEFDIATQMQKYVRWEGEGLPNTPYIIKRFTIALNRVLFCVSDAFFRFSDSDKSGEISNYTKALTVAMFGRVVDDKKIFDMAIDRHKGEKHSENFFISTLYILMQMFFSDYLIKRESRKIKEFYFPIKKNSSSYEILRTIATNFSKTTYIFNKHTNCSLSSALWNNAMLAVLTKARGAWDNVAFGDFGYLLSSCSDVESADVPAAIEELGFVITQCIKPEEFKNMKPEDAVSWLHTTPSKAGTKFREFLKRHGHRCVKEFDIFSVPWDEDPKSLVKILQNLAGTKKKDPEKKSANSVGEILSKLHVKLSFLDRLKLRMLLPNCRRGVRSREFSKSLLVTTRQKQRIAFRKLADALVEEGRLPNKEMLYFLEPEELRQLLETRSPRLVAKAFRRWKFYPELDKLMFPETTSGIPKPINLDEDIVISDKGYSMTGVPVSQGVVKGTARVVVKLEEANKIQPGDILITYATDIGWSPYFALLSGVATELGGLISHGAVVAREYGLPCVVNLHGATRVFASGDQVLLDGNRGILQKIEST